MLFLLANIFENLWNKFYNNCVKDVSPYTRGMIIGIGFLLACVLLVYALKGGEKGNLVNNWVLFWLAIIVTILCVVYILL